MELSPKEFKQKANQIKTRIESANKILVTIHRSPDVDSVACATAMARTLSAIGKDATIVSPEEISDRFSKLPNFKQVQTVDYRTFPFNDYDLLVLLDTPPQQFSPAEINISLPKIPTVIIDHHRESLKITAEEAIVEADVASCAQIVYKFLKTANYPLDKITTTLLLAGIYSDSNGLKTQETDAKVFKIISSLIDDGADYQLVINATENNLSIKEINLLGVLAQNFRLEPERFVWSAIDYGTYSRFGSPKSFTSLAANKFLFAEKDANFGYIIIEKEPDLCQVSLRSKGPIDVSPIARSLGGGGHQHAAAVRIKGNFKKVLEEVIQISRLQAKTGSIKRY